MENPFGMRGLICRFTGRKCQLRSVIVNNLLYVDEYNHKFLSALKSCFSWEEDVLQSCAAHSVQKRPTAHDSVNLSRVNLC